MGKAFCFRLCSGVFLAICLLLTTLPADASGEPLENPTSSISVTDAQGHQQTLSISRVSPKLLLQHIKALLKTAGSSKNDQVSLHLITAENNLTLRQQSELAFEQLEQKTRGVSQTTIDSSSHQSVIEKFQALFPKISKGDIWLGCVQTTLATGASLFSFYLSDTPLPLSLTISATLGLFSGGFQTLIEYWKDFLSKSKSSFAKLAKFHGVEVLFLLVPPAVFAASGHIHVQGFADFAKIFLDVNLTALMTTFSQGFIEKELTDFEKTRGRPKKVLGIDFTNGGFLAASAIAVFSGVSMVTADAVGIEGLKYLAWIGIGSLSAGGVIIHKYRTGKYISDSWKGYFSLKSWVNKANDLKSSGLRCESSLSYF